ISRLHSQTTRRGLSGYSDESGRRTPQTMDFVSDGSSCIDGSGAGLILTNPEGMEFIYALRFRFDATNNEAEYEALIAGLRIAEQMGVKNLQSNVDSQLVAVTPHQYQKHKMRRYHSSHKIQDHTLHNLHS
ncbi:reverse transcriptase domain-containing protein, partial [Tanacetum coccineum]